MTQRSSAILPAIVFSQFAGTSLWFAGNAVLADLQIPGSAGEQGIQWITQSVQLGFIIGTLLFAVFAVADRWSPRLVFFLCSLAGALANIATAYLADSVETLMALRFCTGFFLAGIYPVGMKVAAGWYERGLGNALGLLVGALVLGTAFPHLLQALSSAGLFEATGGPERARTVLLFVSLLAAVGGLVLYVLVPDGPFLTKKAAAISDPTSAPNINPGEVNRATPFAISTIFRTASFRRAAFGYFGHMWELYAFWAFVPFFLSALVHAHAPESDAAKSGSPETLNIALWSFITIAVGFFGCALGGQASIRFGSARVAFVQLMISGCLCLLSPLLFWQAVPLPVALAFVMLWGITVIGDSPQFSALVAATAPRELVGSALTIVNSVGFALTILSIQILGWWVSFLTEPAWLFLVLAPGPLLGLISLRGILRDSG